jgi:ATP-dependent 26S proteasome regulatory subunit
LDNQIKEIKEVIELPVKHPELFEALGIAQPKVLNMNPFIIYINCIY